MKLSSFVSRCLPWRPRSPPDLTKAGRLDYRLLLKRYMCGVLEAEGVTFDDWACEVDAAQVAELKCIRDEILNEGVC